MLGTAFDDAAHCVARQPDDAYLSALLASDTFVAITAFGEDGTVVGGLAGYVRPKFEQARSEFYIHDLAVAEAYRRRGIAIALYTKLGIREDVLHFDIAPKSD